MTSDLSGAGLLLFVSRALTSRQGTSVSSPSSTFGVLITSATEVLVPESKRVLVIDDQEVIRWLLGSALRDRGFQVETAGSGPEGLARVQERPPDAVVLDVMMPDMDGFEVLDALRSNPRTASTPVVVISAAVDPTFRPRARENGAVFLEKPFHWREVVRTVEAALSGGSPAAA